MRVHPRLLAASLSALAAAVGLAACTGDESKGNGKVQGELLSVYASQPLRGMLANDGRDVVRAERLALREAGGRAGSFRVRLEVLDDTSPETLRWAPDVVVSNARRAAQDATTIAYLGELDTGASAVAIPVLNETGILTISPTDTVAGFTRERGAAPGEPDKYYPTRDRSFARLVPPDDIQARAAATLLRDDGVRRLVIVTDDGQYGQALGLAIERAAIAAGIEVPQRRRLDTLDDSGPPEELVDALLPGVAMRVDESGADAVLLAARTLPSAPALLRELHRLEPGLRLYGTNALAAPAAVPALGQAAAVTSLLSPALPPRLNGPVARDFQRRFQKAYGAPPSPFAAYGYEAMRTVLAAIRAAGKRGNNRQAVIESLFRLPARQSAIGTLRIDRNGDPVTVAYGAYRVEGGRPRFERVVAPAPLPAAAP